MNAKDRIIIPLDVSSADEVRKLVTDLAPHVGLFKVGYQLIYSIGAAAAVKLVQAFGGEVFLDGKFHDIPNTVGNAAKEVAGLRLKMLNVHASDGLEAMRAVVAHKGDALALAVTILTSLSDDECLRIYGGTAKRKVLQFTTEAEEVGMDGVICSPQELALLGEYAAFTDGFLKVTPGVRPEWAATDDQKRVMTPGEAILAGADYLVIGRPITDPPKEIGGPVEAAKLIIEEIETALANRAK